MPESVNGSCDSKSRYVLGKLECVRLPRDNRDGAVALTAAAPFFLARKTMMSQCDYNVKNKRITAKIS